jgi:hypothetical protein
LQTATQVLAFAWEPVGHRALFGNWYAPLFWHREAARMRYHVELAADPDFNRIVLETNTHNRALTSGILEPGTYYWRVASVAPNGLEGKPSTARELQIARKLGVTISGNRAPITHAGQLMAGPADVYTVAAADAETSVVAMEVSLDDGPFKPYTRGVRFTESGTRTLTVRGLGRDGVLGNVERIQVLVDAVAPQVAFQVPELALQRDGRRNTTVIVTASDDTAVARIETALDGGAYQTYETPLILDADRAHRVTLRAVDVVGNVSAVRRVDLAEVPR